MHVKWGSAIKSKGWDGLNNAAINVFNSHVINSFVREMFQNSNDARDPSLPIDPKTGKKPPLKLSINYKKFSRSQYPDFDGFIKIFALIKNAKPNIGHIEFFKNGEKALGNRDEISFFVFEDFNTIGLEGDDEDATKSFNACVLSEGLTVKQDETAGGSYGIGKNAIFGFSKLRTVFYTSLNTKGQYIFQGIAKLASYADSDGRTHESRIFCGSGVELKSIRDHRDLSKDLQAVFKRDEPGLSQFAVCPSDNPNWVEEFSKAILRNYWLLIFRGDLVVDFKKDDEHVLIICKDNLEELLLRFFDPEKYKPEKNLEPSGNPLEFFRSFLNGTVVSADIKILGNVRFYFRELENNKSNKIAYIRNGMVVYSEAAWGFGSINYCGVFICENDEGNKILRQMEPPTHDSFAPERLNEKSSRYTSKEGEQILDEIQALIEHSLQEIADKYKKPVEDIPWLDELVSSLSGVSGGGRGNRTNEPSKIETSERIGSAINKTLNFTSLEKDSLMNHDHGELEGKGGGSAGGTAGGFGTGKRGKHGGKGGGTHGDRTTKKIRIKSRIYKTGVSKEMSGVTVFEYKIFINAAETIPPSDILLTQMGDSGNVVSFELVDLKDTAGNDLTFVSVKNTEGEITSYRLQSVPAPCELVMLVREPYKSSFRINTSR